VTGGSNSEAFTGTVPTGTVTTPALAGFYKTSAAGTSSTLAEIVAPTGQVYTLVQGSGGVTVAGTGTVSPTGTVAVTTNGGAQVSGTVSSSGTATAAVSGVSSTVTGSYSGGTAAVTVTALVNTSGRASVSASPAVGIEGFVVTGASRPILVIGLGPELSAYKVTGYVAAPRLDLYNASGTDLATNTGWQTASNAAAITAAASAYAGTALVTGSADAAILTTLPAGAYTAQLSTAGSAGVGLVEVFDTASAAPTSVLTNTSTRGAVGSGSAALIHGFVVGGTAPSRVLVRGIGPGLTAFGVGGALATPVLTVYDVNGAIVATNTGWTTSVDAAAMTSDAVQVGAFALGAGSADSEVLVSLNPGSYTATVTGVGGATGTALVEVYQLP
jgi:hypothetical protein